ncbi:MAG TPA: hypothetical protein VFA07_01015 [Chthonomonadaceae bacterium]|nr:hypothetical protein [Chthonomonadaceae bacterium]
MTPGLPDNGERDLEKAHLLILRGAYDEAQALLERLSQAGTPPQDIDPLLAMIRTRQEQVDSGDERRRAWRYALRMQTSAARIWRFVLAALLAVYAGWTLTVAIKMGRERGFATVITTQVGGPTMSERVGQTHPWTRPIYVDVIYALVLLLVAVVAMGVILWVSKGAAQWEELDSADATASTAWRWPFNW